MEELRGQIRSFETVSMPTPSPLDYECVPGLGHVCCYFRRGVGSHSMPPSFKYRRILIAAALGVMAVAVHGFHYGIEDETIYLPAVKLLLNPALFPHDTELVHAQTRLTLFPPLMAGLSYITRIPLQWVFFLVYFLTTFLLVLALMRLGERLFDQPNLRHYTVLLVIPILTMPVSGTALFIMDQHLHPRNIATVMILFALTAILDQRPVAASVYLLAAFAMHPLVALYGICLVAFQKWRSACVALLFLGLIGVRLVLGNAPASWSVAMSSVHYYLVTSWDWYNWIGILGPLIGFEIYSRWAHRRGLQVLSALCRHLLVYGVVFLIMALAISWVPWLYRLAPLQPMRHLQLLYILFFVITGVFLAEQFARFRRNIWKFGRAHF